MKYNFRFFLTGLCVTTVVSCSSPRADAAYAFVFSRDFEPEFSHYITGDDFREDFLSKVCKVGDFLVLVDWSSFVFINEHWGFIERGIEGLKDSEWKKIEEVLNIQDAKNKAFVEDWLILEAVATRK